MLTQRVFNVVIVTQNHGIGGQTTATPDAKITYTGAQVSVKNGQISANRRFFNAGSSALSWQLSVSGVQSSSVKVHFAVPQEAAGRPLTVRIFNFQGVLLQTLVNGAVGYGRHTVGISQDKMDGQTLRSGRYLCRIQGQGFDKTIHFVVVR
jgi:hypothetical protein